MEVNCPSNTQFIDIEITETNGPTNQTRTIFSNKNYIFLCIIFLCVFLLIAIGLCFLLSENKLKTSAATGIVINSFEATVSVINSFDATTTRDEDGINHPI